jgi:membrane protein DedA with SNARE-associated domain
MGSRRVAGVVAASDQFSLLCLTYREMALSVFLLMIPESACIPVPSEVTLMAAGLGAHQGLVSYPVAVAAATAGNLVGSLIAYAAGRSPLGARLPHSIAERCDSVFARYGSRAVLVARLLPLARTFVSLPAGRARVPLPSFAVMTLIGCAIWSAAFVFAGDLTGAAWHSASGTVGHVSLALGILILALFVTVGGRPSRASGKG